MTAGKRLEYLKLAHPQLHTFGPNTAKQASHGLPNLNGDRYNTMTTQDTINAVREWGIDKGIIGPNGKADEHTQFAKLCEEVDELRMGIIKDNHDEKIDAIGDCAVVLILLADIIGVPFESCLSSAYHVIKSRTGKMVGGVFVKDNNQ